MGRNLLEDIPCPPPKNYEEGLPQDEDAHDITPDAGNLNEGWPPKGHGKGAFDAFIEAVWDVPDGRRKK
jgi:hypothetical protein